MSAEEYPGGCRGGLLDEGEYSSIPYRLPLFVILTL